MVAPGGAGAGGSGSAFAAAAAPPRSGCPAAIAEGGLNPIWFAQSKLRRRRFDECIEICTDVLQRNPYDQARFARHGAGAA
jgi:hypothetical protein